MLLSDIIETYSRLPFRLDLLIPIEFLDLFSPFWSFLNGFFING